MPSLQEPVRPEYGPLARVVAGAIGRPAWCVCRGHGSAVTMEFGAPHLAVREPVQRVSDDTKKAHRSLLRRRVTPYGDWHLWIWCCHWRITSDSDEIANSEMADAAIENALNEIDGQKLLSVDATPDNATSVLRFEHGVEFQTWPWAEIDGDLADQWMLFMHSGEVFTHRQDGRCCLGPGSQPTRLMEWLSLP